MVDISKKRICADEALAGFLALGPSRTLPRLREKYCRDTGVIPPALSTMKRWSRSEEWQARAREHDSMVQGETSKRTIERDADERASVFGNIQDSLLAMLRVLRKGADRVPVKTVADLEVLSKIIVALSAHGLDIERGKLPDQALLEKIVQQMGGASGNGGAEPPSNEELERLLELAMAEPGKPPN